MPKLYIPWSDFQRDCRELANRIPQNIGAIIAITRGGLIPAGIISMIRDIRIVDTMCVRSYTGDDKPGPLIELKVPHAQPETLGYRTLVLDDLVDTGRTMQMARNYYPDAYFASVYAKPRGASKVISYVEMVPQDHWIVFPWENENC